MTTYPSLGSVIIYAGETGRVIDKDYRYHEGRGEEATILTVQWDEGDESSHCLEEFEPDSTSPTPRWKLILTADGRP